MELAHQFPTRNQTEKPRHSRNGAVWAPRSGCQPMRQASFSPSLFMAMVTLLFSSSESCALSLGNISFSSSAICFSSMLDRTSTRLNSSTHAHLVCRLLLEKTTHHSNN